LRPCGETRQPAWRARPQCGSRLIGGSLAPDEVPRLGIDRRPADLAERATTSPKPPCRAMPATDRRRSYDHHGLEELARSRRQRCNWRRRRLATRGGTSGSVDCGRGERGLNDRAAVRSPRKCVILPGSGGMRAPRCRANLRSSAPHKVAGNLAKSAAPAEGTARVRSAAGQSGYSMLMTTYP
jgi:hypothetical protein